VLVAKSQIAMLPVEWRERRRLQRRFARIEKTLRARNCSHLSPELQARRAQTLDNLHAYAKRGIFPRNFEYPNQHRPVFIDPGGRTCAVAQLMIDSGAAGQAAMISNQANFAYIREMSFPELDDWVNENGLSRDEAARIQPGYPGEMACYSEELSRLAYQLPITINHLIAALIMMTLLTITYFLLKGNRRVFLRLPLVFSVITLGVYLVFFVQQTNARQTYQTLRNEQWQKERPPERVGDSTHFFGPCYSRWGTQLPPKNTP
jgi:hypothetical protein